MGPHSGLVEKDRQGSAIDVQRLRRDSRRKTDVPLGLQTHRCIVPASGYYEWRPTEGGKQPYFISAADSAVLSIAGLWDEWRDPATAETVFAEDCELAGSADEARPVRAMCSSLGKASAHGSSLSFMGQPKISPPCIIMASMLLFFAVRSALIHDLRRL